MSREDSNSEKKKGAASRVARTWGQLETFDGPLGAGSPKRARAGRRRRYIADGFFIMDDESLDMECGFVIAVSRTAGAV